MNSSILRIAFIVLLLQFAVGCVSFSNTLLPETKADPESAYLYGNFYLDFNVNSTSHLRMGAVFEAVDASKKYSIEFERSQTLVAVAVEPGNYVLTKMVFATWDYELSGEEPFTDGPLARPFLVEPGKAYYLADFAGFAYTTSTGTSVKQSWRLKSVKDNYGKTTAEFHETYPGLRQLETKRAFTPE